MAILIRSNPDRGKIDQISTDGLAGTSNSLAYRVHEIEKHLHSPARFLGAAVTPSGETHVADGLGTDVDPFQADAGNDDWGSWLQIIGSSDTPVIAGMVKFDLHQLEVTASERTAIYLIQIGFGATGAAALSAGNYTELIYRPAATTGRAAPIKIQDMRINAGTKGWFRTLCVDQNTATIDFYIGLHEYAG